MVLRDIIIFHKLLDGVDFSGRDRFDEWSDTIW